MNLEIAAVTLLVLLLAGTIPRLAPDPEKFSRTQRQKWRALAWTASWAIILPAWIGIGLWAIVALCAAVLPIYVMKVRQEQRANWLAEQASRQSTPRATDS